MSKSKMSKEEKAVRDALAAVKADAGVEKAQQILGIDTTTKSYQNFQSAGAALEAISAKPGSTTKQIQDSLNVYENAYQAQTTPLTSPTAALSTSSSSTGGITNGGIVASAASTISISATAPTPTLQIITTPPTPAIKTATPDIVLFNEEDIDIDEVFDLIFENLGGQELINISRSDIINGQKISYQPIKNLSNIQQRYNPNNIVSLQQTADKYFAGFSIKLEDKVPNEGNGQNGENIYIDEETGDLIIELINLNNDEQIETEITLSGTIYEINLGDYTS
jgi:hypothetical protein